MVNVANATIVMTLDSTIDAEELSIAGTMAGVVGVSDEEEFPLKRPAAGVGVGTATGVGSAAVPELSTMGPAEGDGVGSRANTSSKTVFN